MSAVEMDCVEGRRYDKKAILTLLFRRYSFQIIMLLPEKNQQEVARALDLIEGLCGDDFPKYFGVILTDRGSEFLNYERIETSRNGKPPLPRLLLRPDEIGPERSVQEEPRETQEDPAKRHAVRSFDTTRHSDRQLSREFIYPSSTGRRGAANVSLPSASG